MMKMTVPKMRKILEERLAKDDRKFMFDREKEVLRVENIDTKKGINISLAPVINKWEVKKDEAIEEIVYYVEEALNAFDAETT